MFDVTGQHVLVTGGARGIGRMIAEGLLRQGVIVYISTRKQDAADKAARDLSGIGNVHAFAADIGTEQGCRELVSRVATHTNRLHALINNAGATWGAPFEEFPDAAWDKVISVNVKAPFNLAKAARSLLEADATDGNGPARILNIGSIDGLLVPRYENYSYSAAKAAVHHLTRHLAATLAPTVLVNAIAPGPFPTTMMEWAFADHRADIEQANPLRRIGRPEDINGLVTFLLSQASSFITGAVIPLDGGMTATASATLFDAQEA